MEQLSTFIWESFLFLFIALGLNT